MTTLKIKDNSVIAKTQFAVIPNLTAQIADYSLAALERAGVFVFPTRLQDSADLTQEQFILQGVNETYRSSNVMGFLGCGAERLVIASRFATDDDYFLQYMLQKVLAVPNLLTLQTSANSNNRVLPLMLYLFPHYLKTALRKGLFKTYLKRCYNDGNVQGTIDIARHLRSNTPFTGKIAYHQREFSHDNDLIQLIRHTIEYLKRKPQGQPLLRQVQGEVDQVVAATPTYDYYARPKVIAANKNVPIRHAYYHDYQALQQLCIMILQHDTQQFGVGQDRVHGVLFDGAWLWEEYVYTLLQEDFYHPMNKGGGGAQQLFSKSSGGKVGLVYPDFISRDTHARVIADAKYKPAGNIRNKDYLQVLAYMFRFDAQRGYYLYPEQVAATHDVLFMNEGSTYESNVTARDEISVIKCGLLIPSAVKSFADFDVQMEESENIFRSKIRR